MSPSNRPICPVLPFDRAGEGYALRVREWLANPHAYFKCFGPEARAFQKRHPSERLRTMTFVAPAAELVRMTPVRVCVDGKAFPASSWDKVFALVVARLIPANLLTFDALQAAGELEWLGCPAGSIPVSAVLEAGALQPGFASWEELVSRVQWLFLMCGIRLNEAIVQVNPFTDDQWAAREVEIHRRRAADKAFMEGRRAAQRAWAESHPEEWSPGNEAAGMETARSNAPRRPIEPTW